MAFNGKTIYLVEGEDEKKIIQTLIQDYQVIQPGKVHVLNVVIERITKLKASTWGNTVRVIMVFDTDVEKTEILNGNVELLKKLSNIKTILYIPQVRNLEDELERATSVKNVLMILNSKSLSGFKRDLINDYKLYEHLQKVNFKFEDFWALPPKGAFTRFINAKEKIRTGKISKKAT